MKQEHQNILFIGLGNFADQYTFTRHNIGADFLFYLYDRVLFEERKLFLFFKEDLYSTKYFFIVPKLYMNVSGQICNDLYLKKIILESHPKIIIIHDDLEIPFGQFKFRNNKERGERGHNGNRSINKALKELQGAEYITPYYLSIGIGRPDDGLVDRWVLKKFSMQEINHLEAIVYPEIKRFINSIIRKIEC
jgi:PTH1 family peptidyl-tRNA hydrolase